MQDHIPTAVILWQELGKYLKTEWEVTKPETATTGYYAKRGSDEAEEIVNLKVTFFNTAPERPDWPRIVFTGVGVGLKTSFKHPRWTKDPIIEQPNHSGKDYIIIGSGASDRVFKELTAPESQYGIALFPGDSATLELTMPANEFNPSHLYIEANISKRHFFHYRHNLDISAEMS